MSAGKDHKKDKAEDVAAGFDMYRFFNRWDMILLIAFLVAFLVFTMALFLYPQAV